MYEMSSYYMKKASKLYDLKAFVRYDWYDAEREGFEPPNLLQLTVFKTAAFDRSAISPRSKLDKLIDF